MAPYNMRCIQRSTTMEKSADCHKTAAPPIAIDALSVCVCVWGGLPPLKVGRTPCCWWEGGYLNVS